MNLKNYKREPAKLERVDELFLRKLNSLISSATKAFLNYEYSKAKSETETFFWRMFCDNYLEIVKNRIYNEKGQKKESAQYTLYTTLLTILKLMAPITPFITEELFQTYFKKTEKEKSIHLSRWPKPFKEEKADALDLLINILGRVRQEKTKNKKPMNAKIILSLDKKIKEKLKGMLPDLASVTKAEIKEGKFKVEFV